MTFKEKLQMEHPEYVNEKWSGGCRWCPYHYGYEKELKCEFWESDEKCDECWNREIPGTESKAEIDAADYINIYTEGHGKGYTEGLNDAWELARKLYDMKCDEIEKIFDVDGGFWSVIRDFTPQEALAKLKAYEEQSKIEVGDVVELPVGTKCVVTSVKNDRADGFTEIGYSYYDLPLDELKKTGKHIDIKSILESIGE